MLRVVRQLSTKTGVAQRSFGAAAAVQSTGSGVPSYATHAPPTETSTAGNGVKVTTESLFEGDGVVSVSVKIGVGSRHETANVNGIAAFAGAASVNSVSAETAKLGGNFTSSTDRETTTFSATVMKKDVAKAMELMGKIVMGPIGSVDRDAFAGRVECATSDYRATIMDQLHEAAFLSTPLAMNPMGSGATVGGLSAPDLEAFKKANYGANAMSVSVGGAGVDHAAVRGLVEKSLAGATPSSSLAHSASPAIFTGSDKRIRFDSHPDALVAVAFAGASASSADAMPLHVMKHVLGDWSATGPIGQNSSNKLGREFAEGNFVKSYSAFNNTYADTGLFGVVFNASDNNLEDSMWYLMDNMVRLCHDVTDEEVQRAKASLITSVLTTKGSAASLAEFNGAQLAATGRVQSTAELIARIDGITTTDIKAVANTYINDEDHALAAVGPIFELPDYNWIRRRSYWHRF